jgi:hypothetical protein
MKHTYMQNNTKRTSLDNECDMSPEVGEIM